MKICIIGQGYIGLPTAALFASNHCDVVGVDRKEDVVDKLNHGQIHIEEPHLGDMIRNAVDDGFYHASTKPEEADVFIITVQTPNCDDELLSCDLSYVLGACKDIIPYIKKGNIVIVESTIAPRSIEDYITPLFVEEGFSIGEDLYLAHCPERVLPGKIIEELVNNDRIVGGATPECSDKVAEVYKIFVKGNITKTDSKVAELSKCMENTFRDVNIALANELAKICNELNINCLDVISFANRHPRVNIHQPGPGVGGHCLAIDPYFIYAKVPETAKIIKLARDTNNSMPEYVVEQSKKLLKNITNPVVTILGVTYKGNIDDERESPAQDIIRLFREEEIDLRIHDPHVKNPEYIPYSDAIEGSDLLVILADHNEFKTLNYTQIEEAMRTPMIFDTKNILSTNNNKVEIINYGNIYKHI